MWVKKNKIGTGAYGSVYEAESEEGISAIKRNIVCDEVDFIYSVKELDILMRLRGHPFIVLIDNIIFDNPFIDGPMSPIPTEIQGDSRKNDRLHFSFAKATCNLYDKLTSMTERNFDVMKRYMIQLLLAVEHMHHRRDIKENNILVYEDIKDHYSNKGVVRLCDFGMSKPFSYQDFNSPNVVTINHRAPEILLEQQDYDYSSDIWSLGCVFYNMIALKCFSNVIEEAPGDALLEIMQKIPENLTTSKFRAIFGNRNKYGIDNMIKHPLPTFADIIGLSEDEVKLFEEQAGDYGEFCSLLSGMIRWSKNERYTATQCLSHPFFDEYRSYIEDYQNNFNLPLEEEVVRYRECKEREWGLNVLIELYNKSIENIENSFCDMRTFFHAADIFDRYIYWCYNNMKVPSNAVETDYKGKLFEKNVVVLIMYTCLYIMIKYFSDGCTTPRFKDILLEEHVKLCLSESGLKYVNDTERYILGKVLGYRLYYDTLYEAADSCGINNSDDNRNLFIIYCMNPSCLGKTHANIYNVYRTKMKPHLIVDQSALGISF
jgi:serine/threonine protein kinase